MYRQDCFQEESTWIVNWNIPMQGTNKIVERDSIYIVIVCKSESTEKKVICINITNGILCFGK